MSIQAKLRRKERRQLEREKAILMGHMKDMYCETVTINNQPSSIKYYDFDGQIVSLGSCSVPSTPTPPKQALKKENKMSYCDDCDCCESNDKRPVETLQREYLLNQLSEAYVVKDHEAAKTFFLNDDKTPSDGEEMVARITAGKFILDTDAIKAVKNGKYFYNHSGALLGITWRDPAKPADKDGYKAFMEKLQKSYKVTQRTINIGSPADGLAALNTFESATIN